MFRLSVKPAIAALGLVLSFGISHASAQSSLVGGWQVTPDAGVVLAFDTSTTDTLRILSKTVTFTTPAALGITFTQMDQAALPFIEIENESITNSTGAGWTAFTYQLNPSTANFDGVGNVFAPPIGSGVNFISANLNPVTHDTLIYTGTQSDGAKSIWGSSNPGDDLLIDTNASPVGPGETFTLLESPTEGGSQIPGVPLPRSAWQCLALFGLMAIFAPATKKIASVFVHSR